MGRPFLSTVPPSNPGAMFRTSTSSYGSQAFQRRRSHLRRSTLWRAGTNERPTLLIFAFDRLEQAKFVVHWLQLATGLSDGEETGTVESLRAVATHGYPKHCAKIRSPATPRGELGWDCIRVVGLYSSPNLTDRIATLEFIRCIGDS